MEPITGYQLVKRLGLGGSGEVWHAVGPGGFPVALKFIRLGSPPGEAELRSLTLLRQVRHPNLLGQFGAWQRDGVLIIAMELAEGNLKDRLNRAVESGLPGIPLDELLEFMRDAARGLDYLNLPRPEEGRLEGVQHRDVKPANLMLVGGGVKLGDFGLVKALSNAPDGNTGSLTVGYAAPECFNAGVSAHSDQYSLAVTYCQLRGNRLPFQGTAEQVMFGHFLSPPDLSMLPGEERDVVARALSKQSQDRWPSCRAFIQALTVAARVSLRAAARLRKANAVVAVPVRGEEKPAPKKRNPSRRPRKRKEAFPVSVLVAVVILSFGLALGFVFVTSSLKEFFGDLGSPGQQEKRSGSPTMPGRE
jgi:serine/threonine protein kinase